MSCCARLNSARVLRVPCQCLSMSQSSIPFYFNERHRPYTRPVNDSIVSRLKRAYRSREKSAQLVGQYLFDLPISRTSLRALATTTCDIDALCPAYIFIETTYIQPQSDVEAYLRSDLATPQLNDVHHLLWLAGLPSPARPLHRQKLPGRNILITEDPTEHLVWSENEIYVKPLPDYSFGNDFWVKSICGDRELR